MFSFHTQGCISNNMQISVTFFVVFVFQEMDSIVDQMMTVAEYIGWETKELRPVIFFIRCQRYWGPCILCNVPTNLEWKNIWTFFLSDPSRNDAGDRLRFWWHSVFRRMEARGHDHNPTSCASWFRYGTKGYGKNNT